MGKLTKRKFLEAWKRLKEKTERGKRKKHKGADLKQGARVEVLVAGQWVEGEVVDEKKPLCVEVRFTMNDHHHTKKIPRNKISEKIRRLDKEEFLSVPLVAEEFTCTDTEMQWAKALEPMPVLSKDTLEDLIRLWSIPMSMREPRLYADESMVASTTIAGSIYLNRNEQDRC